MLDTLNRFKNLKESEELLLAYQGMITDSLTNNLIALAENKLAMVEYNSRIKKKVFNILVEVLQNIYHNQEEMKNSTESFQEIMIMVVKNMSTYEVISGNFIKQKNTDHLKKRIEEINQLTNDELRAKYRSKLDEGVFSETGRAGLGIMDMVRKSGQPLQFGFKPINDEYAYFSLQVNIKH
ncbi:SiaB family protein kinase [Marivirga salinae]|uniref:SiaB family protein kinase n=1 Tax=Marivirga salinarum TaxID=3059078 RepID=A0AA51RE77_9BACT|nr:SiaB family protein kinase [Marivirga sp. BDSF4-3]WMN11145.1 SiaB family protein kinase [Marivirga sp. BDSF4-3]